MVLTGETVFCIVCFAQHEKHPAAREDEFNGRLIDGVWAKDYSYYRDNYKGTYGPICNEHTRDEISDKKDADFDTEYSNKFSM